MKNKLHKFLITLLVVLFLPVLVQAQRDITHRYYSLSENRSFAHWSYMISFGGNIFDGDVRESHNQFIPTSNFRPTIGAALERSFNPVFGLGLQYMYIPYQADADGLPWRVQGTAHEATAFLSVNLLNLFYQTRRQNWNVYANIGFGVSFYNAETINRETGEHRPDGSGGIMRLDDGIAAAIPLGLHIEYNVSRGFAIGAKFEYRMHDRDNFEGATQGHFLTQGNSNDAFMTFALTLRHKMHFRKANHVRNSTYAGAGSKINQRDTEILKRRVNDLQDVIEEMLEEMSTASAGEICCKEALKRIEILENQLAQERIQRPVAPERETRQVNCDFNPSDYETLTYVTAEQGTHLAVFSTQFYGSFMFWPYIYLSNTDVLLSGPNVVSVGTRLRIPRLPATMVDANNPEAVERVNCIKRRLGADIVREQEAQVQIQQAFDLALRGVQFETARAVIRPVSFPILDNVATIMRENPDFELDIIGHTDNVGSETSNLDLSERRANSVRQYLIDKGVNASILTAEGKGLSQPIATNATAEGRAQNRRVEFVVRRGGAIIYSTDTR